MTSGHRYSFEQEARLFETQAEKALDMLDDPIVMFCIEQARVTINTARAALNNTRTANDYQAAALVTANKDLTSGEQLMNAMLGLNGEAGECADILKKYMFQGHELDKGHLAKELGDVAWYLALGADALGYDLDTVLDMNVRKLQKRYPEGFKAANSVKREEGDL